jgi:hypothetical protein
MGSFIVCINTGNQVDQTEGDEGHEKCPKYVNEKPFCRPRRREAINIKIHLTEIGSENMEWTQLAQNKSVVL